MSIIRRCSMLLGRIVSQRSVFITPFCRFRRRKFYKNRICIFDLFCTSTHRLYFDLNLTSTFLSQLYFDFFGTTLLRPKLYFDLFSQALLRPKLYFDLCFLTNKKSRVHKMLKYRGRSKRVEVKQTK